MDRDSKTIMTKKKTIENVGREIQDGLAQKKIILGTALTIKALRSSKLQRVILSSNVPEAVRKDVAYYASLNQIEIEEIPQTNEELGVLCKKPFSVSVAGMLKK